MIYQQKSRSRLKAASPVLALLLFFSVAHSATFTSISKTTLLSPGIGLELQMDAQGNTYVASESSVNSAALPLALVAPDGTVTYLSKATAASSFVLDDSGNIWIISFGQATKLDASGNVLARATELPQPLNSVDALVCDHSGNLYLAVGTQTNIAILEFDPSGNRLNSYTIPSLGHVNTLAVDNAGALYVGGYANNQFGQPFTFPTTPGAYEQELPAQSSNGLTPYGPGFVMKFAPGLSRLVFSTWLTGTDPSNIATLAVDPNGDVLVGGSGGISSSGQAGYVPFPLTNQTPLLQLTGAPDSAAFIAKLDSTGSKLIYSSGLLSGEVQSFRLGPNGAIYAVAYVDTADVFKVGALIVLDSNGNVTRQQFIHDLTPADFALRWLDLVLLPDGTIRVLASLAQANFPQYEEEADPLVPYLIDFPGTTAAADVSVSATLLAPSWNDVDIQVQVKNAGPGDAEGIDFFGNGGGEAVNCSADGYAICHRINTTAWWIEIPKLAAGAQINLTLAYRNELTFEDTGKFGLLALPLSADPDLTDNGASFTFTNPPISSVRELNVGLGAITFYRSDYAARCDASCSNYQLEGSNMYTYGEKVAASSVSVWVPSPQRWYGNWWTFRSWADGVTDNPRVFETTHDVPLTVGGLVFDTAQALGTDPTSLDLVGFPGSPTPDATMTLYPPGYITAPFLLPGPSLQAQWSLKTDLTWLNLSMTQVAPNGVLSLSATAQASGMKPGAYSGSFTATVTLPQQAPVSMNVPVTLRVVAATPVIDAIVDSASYRSSAVSLGQIITIFGSGLGPEQGVTAPTPSAGQLVTSLGGTSVWFDNRPVPLLYAQSNQVVALLSDQLGQVTYSYISQTKNLSVQFGSIVAASKTLTTDLPTPTLFTSSGSGTGNLAAVNQDGSINSPEHPAARGSMVLFYGGGLLPLIMHPDNCDVGEFASGVLARVEGTVEVNVGGQPAWVLFAGVPLGMFCPLEQFNVLIPDDSPTGPAVPVTMQFYSGYSGWASAQDGLTLAIQ
jgi:uncharacterized protein (TIGR03437 family)